MKYCVYCGLPMDNQISRCPNCQMAVPEEIKPELSEEQKDKLRVDADRFLDQLYQSLLWERLLYRLTPVLGLTVILEPVCKGVGMILRGITGVEIVFGWIYAVVLGGLWLAMAALCWFVFAPRVTRCMETLDEDIRPTVERYTSSAPIVWSAILCTLLLIPTIISTVRVRSNSERIDYIIARQNAEQENEAV